MATKTKTKAKRAPRQDLERMTSDMQAPKGLSPAERKAWEAARDAGSGKSWKGEKIGDYLTGKLVSFNPSQKTKFGSSPVLYVQPKGEQAARQVYCGTVLARVVEEVQPKVGQSVMIVYKGQAGGKKGRPAELYELTIVGK